MLTLGLIMGYRPEDGASGVLAAVALVVVFGLSLSLLWAAVALAVHDPAVVISIANAVLIPLSFAGNIFVQPRSMPGWLQAFVDVNPLSHVATAARGLMNDAGGVGGAVAWSLTASAVIALVCTPITLRLYGRQGRARAWTPTAIAVSLGRVHARTGDGGGDPAPTGATDHQRPWLTDRVPLPAGLCRDGPRLGRENTTGGPAFGYRYGSGQGYGCERRSGRRVLPDPRGPGRRHGPGEGPPPP